MLSRSLLLRDLPDDVSRWLARALENAELAALRGAFLAARTVAGRDAWEPGLDTVEVLRQNRLGWLCERAALDDVVRIALVMGAARRSDDPAALVEHWVNTGRAEEQRSVLRSLSLLPRPKRYLPLAIRAARTSDEVLFEAIACDNPYPAAYFDDADFDAMLARALDQGLHPARILDATERMDHQGAAVNQRPPWITPPAGIPTTPRASRSHYQLEAAALRTAGEET